MESPRRLDNRLTRWSRPKNSQRRRRLRVPSPGKLALDIILESDVQPGADEKDQIHDGLSED